MLSYDEAISVITAPGERFELAEVEVRGVPTKVFKHAPPTLREVFAAARARGEDCLLYTSPSPRDRQKSRMPSSA